MNLKEFEGKALFREAGIKVPRGRVVRTPDEAWEALEDLEITDEVVLKAQVHTGKRGKSGGIAFANAETVREEARLMFEKSIRSFKVKAILIEEKLLIEEELYVAITIDRHSKCMTLMCSRSGGMDIEEIARTNPEKILKLPIVDHSLSLDQTVQLASKLSTEAPIRKAIADVMLALYDIVLKKDATLVEINPLIITTDHQAIAADSKVVIDDNALFRQPDFRRTLESEEDKTALEKEAFALGFAYVELEGTIGVIGNGAGLTMTMIDLIHHFDGEPANFLDIGGAARTHEMEQALELVLKKEGVQGVCINIFGGITHCDEIAQGILDYRSHHKVTVPFVVRMVGTNVAEATELLSKNGIHVLDSLEEAVEKIIELA